MRWRGGEPVLLFPGVDEQWRGGETPLSLTTEIGRQIECHADALIQSDQVEVLATGIVRATTSTACTADALLTAPTVVFADGIVFVANARIYPLIPLARAIPIPSGRILPLVP